MKSSTVAIILSFTASTIAAPYTKAQGLRTRSPASDCSTNANPNACLMVVNAITGWATSVNGVNDFLNTANSITDPATLTSAENNALTLAMKEPGFLSVLRSTTNIDASGTAAAATLDTFFPTIPQDLMNLLTSAAFVDDAVNDINSVRCAHVLPAIGDLWIAAALAVGADPPDRPAGPNFCPAFSG